MTSYVHSPEGPRVSYRIFWWGGGEEVCGRARTHNTYVLAYVQARGVWGHAPPPPPEKIFLDLLRLLLTQSETKFPAIILMTHRC